MKLKSPHPSLRATFVMRLVAADVSPLHLVQGNVRADSRRLLRLDSIRPKVERSNFLPLPAKWGEGRGEGFVLIFQRDK